MALNIGDKIPEILGVNQEGKEVKASDYAGSKLVLYFYPKDSTPGCTAEPVVSGIIFRNCGKPAIKY